MKLKFILFECLKILNFRKILLVKYEYKLPKWFIIQKLLKNNYFQCMNLDMFHIVTTYGSKSCLYHRDSNTNMICVLKIDIKDCKKRYKNNKF